MKAANLKYGVLSVLVTLVALIIALMPFHAFLTVWGAHLVGHYTALRLWKEALLLICMIGTLYLIIFDRHIRSHALTRRLIQLILLYVGIVLVWGAFAYAHHNVTAKALGYGLIVDLRFPIFFLVCWTVALRTSRLRDRWPKLLFWPAAIVVVFGLLQIFVLPHNFLSHFGYGPTTIAPYETINHNSHYIRIMSTLRGANPLGAYLLVPLSALGVLISAGRRQWKLVLLLLAGLIVLFFSFSRSAWLAVIASGITIILLQPKLRAWRTKIAIAIALIVIVLGGLTIGFRHNQSVQNIILHTQANSAIKATSDQGHTSALRDGLHDIIRQPLGRGPGTAGPASTTIIGHRG